MWFERCTAHVARRQMQKTVCKSAIARYFISASDHASLCGRLCLSASWACYIYHLHTWTPEHLCTYLHTWTHTYLPTHLPTCMSVVYLPAHLTCTCCTFSGPLTDFICAKDDQRCSKRCSKMFKKVHRCSKMFKGVQRCMLTTYWSPLGQGRPSLSWLATWHLPEYDPRIPIQIWNKLEWWQWGQRGGDTDLLHSDISSALERGDCTTIGKAKLPANDKEFKSDGRAGVVLVAAVGVVGHQGCHQRHQRVQDKGGEKKRPHGCRNNLSLHQQQQILIVQLSLTSSCCCTFAPPPSFHKLNFTININIWHFATLINMLMTELHWTLCKM